MSTPVPAIAPGITLGRYQILELLGSGGMGAVFLAQDSSLGRQVAIKMLDEANLQSGELRARFAREARAVAAINHPNVIQIFDIAEHQGRPYFVMEYLKGMDASALLEERGRLPAADAVAIALGAAQGLAEAAAAGVVHRDVKPANIFVSERGLIKVMDFGLVKGTTLELGTALTIKGLTLGTPDYMPPEQARGQRVDPRADIYSLGCTLFHLLAGRPPYRENEEQIAFPAVVARHLQDPVPTLEEMVVEIDPTLALLVRRMMGKDPATRPSYEEILSSLHDLAQRMGASPPRLSLPLAATAARGPTDATTSPPVSARPPAPVTRPSLAALRLPWAIPRWVLILTMISVAIFLLSLGLFLLLHPRPAPPPAAAAVAAAEVLPHDGSAALPTEELRMITMRIPSIGLIEVAAAPFSVRQAAERAPDLAYLLQQEGDLARGLSLEAARLVVRRMGGRLPTTKEWFYLEGSPLTRIVPEDCEWVDDGPTRKARCFKGTRAVVRAIDRPYRNSIFRLVRSAGSVRP